MDKKTSEILIRSVKIADKKALVKKAKKNRISLNLLMLHAIDYYLSNEISTTKELSTIN